MILKNRMNKIKATLNIMNLARKLGNKELASG